MSDVLAPRSPALPGASATAVVDVVVPVHDEEAVLAASVRRLHAFLGDEFPFGWRITIADNASTDGTEAVGRSLASTLPGVRYLRLDRKGRGRALRAAWLASDSEVVAYMDVDLSTGLDALLPMVAPLVSGHSDVAIGSRLAPGASVARGPKRELISRAWNLVVRAMFATRVQDLQCGFKAVRSEVARDLLPAVEDDGWFFDTELLLLAERNHLRIHQVPVDWIDDPDSRVDLASTAREDLKGAWRLFRSFSTGGGIVALTHPRPTLADDFGRRLVRFGLIGAASTLVSLVLFLVLRAPLGAIVANAVAVTATFAANTWLNARYTLRAARPRWRRATVLFVGALGCTSGVLVAVDALGGGSVAEVVALLATWVLASVARFALLGPTEGDCS